MSQTLDPVSPILHRLLQRLAQAGVLRDFYLAGGTGLALLLQHRRSVDPSTRITAFGRGLARDSAPQAHQKEPQVLPVGLHLDFFSRTNHLGARERRFLLGAVRRLGRWTLREANEGTVQGRIGRVRVSFFWYPERLIKPSIRQGPVRIASLEDIGLMKIGAIIGRGSRKDFVDLYTIAQQRPLSALLALAPKKFTDARDFTLQAFKALTFFEDAERDPPVITAKPMAWNHVKNFFSSEVRTLARRYLAP